MEIRGEHEDLRFQLAGFSISRARKQKAVGEILRTGSPALKGAPPRRDRESSCDSR
jgi:hypothetical protein